MNNTLKLLDLFSGIGGFSLGFERTNRIKTIAFCEKDKFCQTVLKKHWKDIKIYDDIRNINGSEIKADIITGGFPCQPFSVAGKRRGKDDDRYLWDETLRVVAETKPRWFVGENVDGIINIANGSILQQIQKDLEKENFQVQSLVIPASGIGAWHQRKRVWIIGYSDCNANSKTQQRGNGKENSFSKEYWSKDSTVQFAGGTNNNSLSNSNSSLRRRRRAEQQSGKNEKRKFHTEEEKQSSYDLRSKTIGCNALLREREKVISNTERIRSQRHKLQSSDVQKKIKTNKISSPSIKEQQTWWQTQSKLCGVPDGISYELDKDRANRIKALGNSIVPEIAYLIANSIIFAEDEQQRQKETIRITKQV